MYLNKIPTYLKKNILLKSKSKSFSRINLVLNINRQYVLETWGKRGGGVKFQQRVFKKKKKRRYLPG